MDNSIKKGTGLSVHSIDYEQKKISIDLSGMSEDDVCFRNDASIFFFAANSYKQAFYLLGKTIEERFEKEHKEKEIEHLILPYYFNFRHYVELELKGIITAVMEESPKMTHNLKELIEIAKEAISSIEPKQDEFFYKEANKHKVKAQSLIETIEIEMKPFFEQEPAADFYRYVFGVNNKNIVLNQPVIRLDYSKADSLFIGIVKHFNNLYIELRETGTYVYQL